MGQGGEVDEEGKYEDAGRRKVTEAAAVVEAAMVALFLLAFLQKISPRSIKLP